MPTAHSACELLTVGHDVPHPAAALLLARLMYTFCCGRTHTVEVTFMSRYCREEKKEKDGEGSMVTAHTNKQNVRVVWYC